MRCQLPHRLCGFEPDAVGNPPVVEKRDVLRPRQPDHDVQPVPRSLVEHVRGWRRVGSDRVDAGGRHQAEVVSDPMGFWKLRTGVVGGKRAVGDPLHEEAAPIDLEEFTVYARCALGRSRSFRRHC